MTRGRERLLALPRFFRWTLLLVIPACSSGHPRRNTSSDLVAFSRVDSAWATSRGAGVTVAILDWQFDPRGGAAASYVGATSMVPGERMGDLKPWHGSWMVNIVHRVAPEAQIMPIIARSLKQPDFQQTLIAGIRYAAEHGATVVTSSMGVARQSEALRDAIDFAESRGTLFVNVHPEGVGQDAGKTVMCTRGQCDERIVHAGIVSVPEHRVRPNPARDVYAWPYDLDGKFEDGWGYSIAPPVIAGVIALAKGANGALTPAELRELLVTTARPHEGFRVVDATAAVKRAAEMKQDALSPRGHVR